MRKNKKFQMQTSKGTNVIILAQSIYQYLVAASMSPANRRIDNVLNNPSEKLTEHEDLIVLAKWSSLIIEDKDEYWIFIFKGTK